MYTWNRLKTAKSALNNRDTKKILLGIFSLRKPTRSYPEWPVARHPMTATMRLPARWLPFGKHVAGWAQIRGLPAPDGADRFGAAQRHLFILRQPVPVPNQRCGRPQYGPAAPGEI